MISDTLAEAYDKIQAYVKDFSEAYADYREEIEDLLIRMNALREKLDTPPTDTKTP